MITSDSGTCAPSVRAGHSYTVSAWYTSTVPVSFDVSYRLARGVWVYGRSSAKFAPAAALSPARFTLPPIPDGVTAISFGLALGADGELVTDDYALTEGGGPP